MGTKLDYYNPFRGAGKIYLREYGKAEALAMIGNCNNLKFSAEIDEQDLADYMTSAGGTYATESRVKSAGVAFDAYDWNIDNLARITAGVSTNSTPTGDTQTFTAYQGGLIQLSGLNPTGVTIKDTATGTTTFAADTDYEVRPEGIYILGGAIADGTDIDVTVTTYSAEDLIQALLSSGKYYELVFAGINAANGDAATVVTAYKAQFGPGGLDLITDSFGALSFSGKLIKDTTVIGTGKSQYYTVKKAA